MAYQVDTVFVWVTDLTESSGWYSQFGIEAGPRYGGWQLMIVDGDTRFALHEGNRAKGPSTGAIAFKVDDLDKAIARLAGLAITPTDAEITDTGIARFATFRDPDGNDIQLLER